MEAGAKDPLACSPCARGNARCPQRKGGGGPQRTSDAKGKRRRQDAAPVRPSLWLLRFPSLSSAHAAGPLVAAAALALGLGFGLWLAEGAGQQG
jgi:hypothetical protein